MTWETNIDLINRELELRLKEIPRLEGRVIRATPSGTREYPTLWIHLERIIELPDDESSIVSVPFIEHEVVYRMLFEDVFDSDESAEDNENEKIKRFGEIVDKLNTYRVNYPEWHYLWFSDIEYAQLRREGRYFMLDVEAELRVRKAW